MSDGTAPNVREQTYKTQTLDAGATSVKIDQRHSPGRLIPSIEAVDGPGKVPMESTFGSVRVSEIALVADSASTYLPGRFAKSRGLIIQ